MDASSEMLRVARARAEAQQVPVAFGVGLILLLALLADGLSRAALCWAAFFTAISPAMVFYSRYFIHEMLLVFFTLVALAGGWRWLGQAPSATRIALTVAVSNGWMTFVRSLGTILPCAVATTSMTKAQLSADQGPCVAPSTARARHQ